MTARDERRLPPSAAVTSAGLDHVRLSYLYLDSSDIDAYGSLLDDDVRVTRPDSPPCQGRREVLTMYRRLAGPHERHEIYKTVADGDCVAVMGRVVRPRSGTDGEKQYVEFADFFTLSDEGMLLGCRRYYFAPPA
jgi:ketosteroid isomerase-like protein